MSAESAGRDLCKLWNQHAIKTEHLHPSLEATEGLLQRSSATFWPYTIKNEGNVKTSCCSEQTTSFNALRERVSNQFVRLIETNSVADSNFRHLFDHRFARRCRLPAELPGKPLGSLYPLLIPPALSAENSTNSEESSRASVALLTSPLQRKTSTKYECSSRSSKPEPTEKPALSSRNHYSEELGNINELAQYHTNRYETSKESVTIQSKQEDL